MTPGTHQNVMAEKTLRMLIRIIERTNKYWDVAERDVQRTANADAIKKLEKKHRIIMANKAPMTSSILQSRLSDYRDDKRITIGTRWKGKDDRYKIFMPPLHVGDG
ncbi:MAG: hypothetical protein E4G74_02315 [Erysipelotrichales bacterium]|nr:MAG: hypothetical protein E4G74_02315 [Erysipelotrichales bacterium]